MGWQRRADEGGAYIHTYGRRIHTYVLLVFRETWDGRGELMKEEDTYIHMGGGYIHMYSWSSGRHGIAEAS
jgi:hypothetical protein